MTVKLIIVRHGNTFTPDETPRRIGAKTDLSLVDSGMAQAKKLGAYLKDNALLPDVVYTSRLKRTIETAEGALKEAGVIRAIHQADLFDEIDHGPDENRPEPEVVNRIGADAYNRWEHESLMPKDWAPQPDIIRRRWSDFANHCQKNYDGKTVLVVTSNGIARFAPHIANNADDMAKGIKRKMSTGALSIIEGSGGLWMISHWNVKP